MISVAVIGAGAAGLAMARYLAANQKLFKFVVYEQGSEVGGTWIYDENEENKLLACHDFTQNGLRKFIENDPVHSSMYKNLRTNLPKQVMEYPDFPFSRECKTFPSHVEVLNYLKAYCTEFRLRQFIRFKTTVKHVSPLLVGEKLVKGDLKTKWQITSMSEDNTEAREVFDSVVVCNGHFSTPNLPDIPNIENFSGTVTHSHFYRVPEVHGDKTVVVLGARSSGRDIAIEVSRVAKRVILSHRGEHGVCPLPENVIEKAPIKSIDESGDVVFEDGIKMQANVIIYCTGYKFDFPFLDEECGIKVTNGRIYPLYKFLFNAAYPSMAIIGVCNIICPFQLFSMQARWIANVLSGEVVLPSYEEMLEDHNKLLNKKLDAGIPERHFHRLSNEMQWEYYKDISYCGQVEPIKKVVEKLYKTVATERQINTMHYRETEYIVNSDENFESFQST